MNLSAKDAAERILMLHKVIDAKRNYLVTLDNALLRASKITIQISGQNGSGYVETQLICGILLFGTHQVLTRGEVEAAGRG